MKEEMIKITIKDYKSNTEKTIEFYDWTSIGEFKNLILKCLVEVVSEKHIKELNN